MEIFDRIAEQLETIGLPLFAVTMTALPRANTPVLLMLHWHGFRTDPDRIDLTSPCIGSPVPGTALQLNPSWEGLARLDETVLDAAWRLGAWELDREERRGCSANGITGREMLECRQAFAEHPFGLAADDFMVTEAPDRSEMLEMGARVGYVYWKFRPVHGGLWRDTARDDSLAGDGSRDPPCPVAAQPAVGTSVSRIHYRLGRIDAADRIARR